MHLLEDESYEGGELDPACRFIRVDEWFMVACPQRKKDGLYDRAVPGGGSAATPEEVEVGPIPTASDAVVISLRPGTTAKPVFFYRPYDHPEWTRERTFRFELSESAMSLDEAELPTIDYTEKRDTSHCASLGPAAPPSTPEPIEIPDIAGHPEPPTEEQWSAEREVMASGSDALGCKTRVKDGWFRARCEGKVAFTEAAPLRGKHATQTKLDVASGALLVLTPYVEGTDFQARLTHDGGRKVLHLRWPKGKRPYEVAKFVDAP